MHVFDFDAHAEFRGDDRGIRQYASAYIDEINCMVRSAYWLAQLKPSPWLGHTFDAVHVVAIFGYTHEGLPFRTAASVPVDWFFSGGEGDGKE